MSGGKDSSSGTIRRFDPPFCDAAGRRRSNGRHCARESGSHVIVLLLPGAVHYRVGLWVSRVWILPSTYSAYCGSGKHC